MAYAVKELYYTLQGEGALAGRGAVFLRFAGCNLWTGREADRGQAVCNFCDTDFLGTNGPGGGSFESAHELAAQVRATWQQAVPESQQGRTVVPLVVCTGGEPLLQLDGELTSALHDQGFYIAVETNGTIPPPPGIDWLCVSPKAGSKLAVERGDELKLVHPQLGLDPASLLGLDFHVFYLQPMDGPDVDRNVKLVTEYCLAHPQWRVSLQIHKLLGLP